MIGTNCAVHVHREAVPLEEHHVWPQGYHGPNVPANRVMLCANGHGMVHYLVEATLKARARDAEVPAIYRQLFGRRTQRLAELGVRRILEQRLEP